MTSLPSGTARPEREHIAEFEDMYAAGREPFDYTLRAVEWLRHELVADTALRLAPRRVLDLGCGLGQISRRLVAPGRQVVATDLSATAVARACRLFPDTAAAFLAGSALDLPFREAAFDVVVASDGLVSWHLNREQRATALGEIRRVLRPGGTALLTEYIRGHQFDEFVAEVVTAGLRSDAVGAITDRPWYWFESWIKAFHHTTLGRRLRSSRGLARALVAAGRPLGRRGARHILVLASRAE